MSLFKRGFFSVGTGAAASTVTVPHGLGETPGFLILEWNGRTETTDTPGNATHHRGAALVLLKGGTFGYRTVGGISQHGVATASRAAKSMLRNDAAVLMLTAAGAVDGRASVQSVDATNIVFVIDDAFSASLRVQFQAFAAGAIDVYLDHLTTPTTGTPPFTTDYTASGLTCVDNRALLVTLGCKSTVINTVADDSDFYLGFATSAAMQRAFACGANHQQATATQSVRYGFTGECIAQLNAAVTATNGRAQLDSWIANGFRLQWNEVGDTAKLIGYAIIRGPKFALLSASMPGTLAGTLVLTGAGFSPIGGIIASVDIASTQDNVSSDDILGLGAFDGIGSEGSFQTRDEDAEAISVVATRVEHDACWARVQPGGTNNATCQVQSLDADGVTYVNVLAGTGGDAATVLFGPAEVLVSASGVSSWESLQGVSAQRGAAWEALSGLSVPRVTAYESQQAVSALVESSWESLQGIARLSEADWESLLGVVAGAEPSWESWRIQVLIPTLLRMRVASGPLFRMLVTSGPLYRMKPGE